MRTCCVPATRSIYMVCVPSAIFLLPIVGAMVALYVPAMLLTTASLTPSLSSDLLQAVVRLMARANMMNSAERFFKLVILIYL